MFRGVAPGTVAVAMTLAMTHAIFLSALAVAPLTYAPPPTPPSRAWWLPTVTLRLSHRDAHTLATDRDVVTTPFGTTLELRLEWRGSSAPLTEP